MTSKTSTPGVWVIRAGRHGEDEAAALEQGLAIVDFHEFTDLTTYPSLEGLASAYLKARPNDPPKRAENYARQLWALRERIAVGDTVVLPLKTAPGQIALGTVAGPYAWREVDGKPRHTRKVKWIRPDVPRSVFQQDLLYSFGAFSTICRIQRNDAEHRVQAVLEGKADPGAPAGLKATTDPESETLGEESLLDLEQAASDEVTAFIRGRFPDHDMARLVEAVLKAEGYWTFRSPPGPDGGADILAGRGSLGLDGPSLCVQVKATEALVDVKVFRELAGTMAAFKATQGLLVSWGGFKDTVKREARQESFKIRLWGQADLVKALYQTYDRLAPEIKSELPLKQVWMLVREAEGQE